MCGRYSQTLPKATVRRVFEIRDDIPLVPRFNISPGTDVAAVRLGAEGRRVLAPLRWGFVPPNAPASAQRPINAMAEHLGWRFWRETFAHRRCALPADSFYEWDKTTKPSRPWRFTRADGGPLALLGVYESWRPPQGRLVESVAVITVPANPLVGQLHDRMPAMLDPEQIGTWLDPNASMMDLFLLLAPYPAEKMRVYPVSPRLNAATFEDPSCVAPWDAEPKLI